MSHISVIVGAIYIIMCFVYVNRIGLTQKVDDN